MLIGKIVPPTALVYPLLRVSVSDPITGLTSAQGYHDLWSAPDEELAGMGLAILGNVIKLLLTKQITSAAVVTLLLIASTAEITPLPWPGMPGTQPIALDLEQLPFDTTMFLGDDQVFTKVLSRWELLARIREGWVPELKRQMARKG